MIKITRKGILFLARKGMLSFIDDELYIRIMYWARLGEKLNLKNPITFNEKLQWLKLNVRKDSYSNLVDKYEVREFITEKIDKEYLIPLIGVWNSVDEIDFGKLPNKFVLKCTHDSGGVVICKDKNDLDIEKVKEKLNKSLKKNYYYWGREWPYKNIKPRIICEEYMVDESGTELKDYKIFCFDGKAKLIQVDYDRFRNHKRNLYDINWNYINGRIQYPNDESVKIKEPLRLNKLLNLAEILAEGFHHARIDFYVINERIYFGEITFFHGGGYEKFEPRELGVEMGEWIKIDMF